MLLKRTLYRCGDINLIEIDWINGLGISSIDKYFYSFTQKNGLLQLVKFNTRNSNILDLILKNDIQIVSSIISTNPIEYDSHCIQLYTIYSYIILFFLNIVTNELSNKKMILQIQRVIKVVEILLYR